MSAQTTFQSPFRGAVLGLYRSILRKGQQWPGSLVERTYIASEARRLFRKNEAVRDLSVIQTKIFEGESRVALAEHYKNPYPRHTNVAPGTRIKNKEEGRVTMGYMDSYD